MAHRTARTATLLALPLLAIGCASDDNARLMLGESVLLASLPPKVPEPVLDEHGVAVLAPVPVGDGPSIIGLDRTGFEPLLYIVPIDGTYHQPEARTLVRFTDETARQRGEFPTAVTALERSTESGWSQTLEILVAPGWSLIDAAITPAELIINPFFETVASPDELPGRTPPSVMAGAPGVLPLTREELQQKLFEGQQPDESRPIETRPGTDGAAGRDG